MPIEISRMVSVAPLAPKRKPGRRRPGFQFTPKASLTGPVALPLEQGGGVVPGKRVPPEPALANEIWGSWSAALRGCRVFSLDCDLEERRLVKDRPWTSTRPLPSGGR